LTTLPLLKNFFFFEIKRHLRKAPFQKVVINIKLGGKS
jgi:hypothetical protein